jgi:uncharacterized RDD family membrane protein YckC
MTEPGSPTPVLPWEAPQEEVGPAPGIEFAGHGARIVAYFIDAIIVSVVIGVLYVVAFLLFGRGLEWDPVTGDVNPDSIDGGAIGAFVLVLLVAAFIALLYFPFFWARGGQTPGMRPFGLRVVRDRDGSRIGWGTALLRLLGMYVASAVFYLGFIWIFIDKRRRGWHDLIAGTVVIKRS